MVRRLFLLLFVCFAAALVGGGVVAQPNQPAHRIVAIGDLHGDYGAWSDIARAAGVIDSRGRWAGGKTVLVQLGDIPDRGPDSLKIIDRLMRLQRDAPRRGGKVIVLVGNHEAMNMTGDLRYVDPGEYAAFAGRESRALRDRVFESSKASIAAQYRQSVPEMTDAAVRERWMDQTPLGWVEHQLAWQPKGRIGSWVMKNPAVAVVDGNLFVHGGISTEYAAFSVAEINRRVADALQARDSDPTAIINDPLGPLWYRGLVERAEGDGRPPIEQELTAVLASFGAKRIIVAHTPHPSGIAVLHGGRLVRVDTGNARYYNGQPSYLEIIGDRLIPHAVPRTER